MNAGKSKTLFNFFQRMVLLSIGSVITILSLNSEYKYHIAAKLIFLFFLILIAIEIHYMLASATRPRSVIISILAALLLPIWSFLHPYVALSHDYIPVFIITGIPFVYILCSLKKKWDTIIHEIQSILFLIIYPGLLSSYLFQIPQLPHPTLHFYAFVSAVFHTDGFAYLVGITIGKLEKKYRKGNLIEFSPGKTISGFIGGLVFCYISFSVIFMINSEIFDNSIPKLLLFATLISLATYLGDLFESALKRICKVKDSGRLMLGRGGVLDTFDSMIFAAPVYLIFYQVMFT